MHTEQIHCRKRGQSQDERLKTASSRDQLPHEYTALKPVTVFVTLEMSTMSLIWCTTPSYVSSPPVWLHVPYQIYIYCHPVLISLSSKLCVASLG